MLRNIVCLLLASRSLAQSADENAYSISAATKEEACTSVSVGDNIESVTQTGALEANVKLSGLSEAASLDYIALKDGWGTIIAYQENVGSTDSVTMTWSMNFSPDELYAQVLSGCALSSSQTSKVETWAFKVSQYITSDAATLAVAGANMSSVPEPTIDAVDVSDMTFDVTFKAFNVTLNFTQWVKGAAGTVLYYSVVENTVEDPVSLSAPEGTTVIEACQSSPVVIQCSSYDMVSDYVTFYESAGSTTASSLVTATKKQGTSGYYHYSVTPFDTSCTDFVIYAKMGDSVTSFAFDASLSFTETDVSEFTAYLKCGTDALKSQVVSAADMTVIGANDIGTPEVIVGYADCDGTYPSGSTFLDADGRNCTCDMGNAYCMAGEADSTFFLSDGEAVGLALSVSIIVILLLMALIFLCLKKTAQKQELVGVLKTNTKDTPPVETDRL